MRIDCHAHVLPFSLRHGAFVENRGVRALGAAFLFWRLGLGRIAVREAREARYLDDLAAFAQGAGIDRVVLLALDGAHDGAGRFLRERTSLFVPNALVAKLCAARPDAFLFGASVHPYRADALDALDEIAEGGAVLVKLLPNSQGVDLADPALGPYFRKLAALRLPLLVHCGFEHTLPVIDQSFGDPVRLENALEEGVTVIVAHAGSAGRFHRRETFGSFLRLLEKYPNCYGDTSALANFWRSKYLFELLDADGLERRYGVRIEAPFSKFVHGSDYPVPVTPFAFSRRVAKAAKSMAGKNPLGLELELKRLSGVPDDVLTRGAKILRISSSVP